jgi:hypothetical protein
VSELLKINVNEHTEKKNGLTYLSWAWAWAEVLKIDPRANWIAVEFSDGRGCAVPFMRLPDDSCIVKTEVTLKLVTRACTLPVMDHRNKAIKSPDAFQVNTAIMRCLAKCIAMHGLGLYIYAGEDLPEGEEKPEAPAKPTGSHSAPSIIFDGLDEDTKRAVRRIAAEVTARMPDAEQALGVVEFSGLDNEARAGLWSLLDSSTRSALKRAKEAVSA